MGLTTAEAARRLVEHGSNDLPQAQPLPLWRRFARQFKSPLIYVLLFAFVFDFAVWFYERWEGWPIEGFVIAGVLLLNAGLGTFQEHRSEQALAQLKALTSSVVWTTRDGRLVQVPSRDLVPGDVIRIEMGERVPADATLLDGQGAMTDEAVLTGESVPVEKLVGDELHSGTLLVRGKVFALVLRTGGASAMGKIATMIRDIEAEKTPLERRLETLGRQITRWVSAVAVVLIVAGTVTEGIHRFDEVVMFAVALAVAAVPEGMPAVVTLALALGVQRMARRRALVRRLSAVEALGSVTVIATDKTGTLTEERMMVQELHSHVHRRSEALRAMVLANDADTETFAGDPLDVGLLAYARSQGVDIGSERGRHRQTHGRPFDSTWKYMRVTVESEAGCASYLKGAPEVVLERCSLSIEEHTEWVSRSELAADRGSKVLALARGDGLCEHDLEFLGLLTLWDPPRPEVAEAITTAQRAGVRVIMITGDHPGTARAVAELIGMPEPSVLTGREIEGWSVEELRRASRSVNVFARVSPAHKLMLVEALQGDGHIVAMTGDGVNDAPALKRADVGIAMGKRGSDVTREVSDLVLLDDNFATIVGAIEEGRGIYENIQTFIRFTFSTNVALMLLVLTGAVVAYLGGLRDAAGALLLPLTAIQLLWINFVGDGPPALALGLDRTPGQMNRPPRPPQSGLLDAGSTRFILATGAFKGALGIALLVLLPAFGFGLIVTQTVIFLYESVGKLVSAYPSRRSIRGRPKNWVLHVSIAGGVALQLLAVVVPGIRRFLGLEMLDGTAFTIIVLAVVATWGIAALARFLIARKERRLERAGTDLAQAPAVAAT
jgi:Ca2+-transporting ATPase